MRFSKFIVSGLLAVTGAANASLVAKRTFIDVCAQVDADLNILGIVFGKVDVCLCVGALPLFLSTDAGAKAAVKVLGSTLVTAALEALINLAPHQSCTYPDNAVPTCSSNCGYDCKPPYIKSGNKCVLPPSNGTRKRSLDTEEASCPWGLQKCGVIGESSHVGFECLDITTNLESCGGCTTAFGSLTKATGVDCTAIEGVSDVGCRKGACHVRKCRAGWMLGDDGNSCVRTGRALLNEQMSLEGF